MGNVVLIEPGLSKTITKFPVADDDDDDDDVVIVLPWLAKEFCIIGIIDVAPTISIDVIATTIMIPLIMWLIIIYKILYN
jgi:hypothetical protein